MLVLCLRLLGQFSRIIGQSTGRWVGGLSASMKRTFPWYKKSQAVSIKKNKGFPQALHELSGVRMTVFSCSNSGCSSSPPSLPPRTRFIEIGFFMNFDFANRIHPIQPNLFHQFAKGRMHSHPSQISKLVCYYFFTSSLYHTRICTNGSFLAFCWRTTRT